MEIKSLQDISLEKLYEAFSDAFENYDVKISKPQLERMLVRRGFVPELSFAAFDGGLLASFTLNGIGDFNGHLTAYDTGTGTRKAYQGQGLARQIFEHSVPFLKEYGIKQYLLEVLQHNTNAISVYKKQGFEVLREFNYFVQSNESVKVSNDVHLLDFVIKEIALIDYDAVSAFWDFTPSWQNSFEAILRKPDDFHVFGALDGDSNLLGYCVFEPVSGDVMQIAVRKDCRRKGIGSSLLLKAVGMNAFSFIKILNTDIHCESITSFLESRNIQVTGRQFEMMRPL